MTVTRLWLLNFLSVVQEVFLLSKYLKKTPKKSALFVSFKHVNINFFLQKKKITGTKDNFLMRVKPEEVFNELVLL